MTQSVSYDPSKFAEWDVEHENKYTIDVSSLWNEIGNIICMKHKIRDYSISDGCI